MVKVAVGFMLGLGWVIGGRSTVEVRNSISVVNKP